MYYCINLLIQIGDNNMTWKFDNNKPIYLQLVEMLKLKIISKELPAGSKLPSVRDFAEEAGVNPNTMQRALAELETQNLVFTQRTSGRFVTEDEAYIKTIRNEYARNKVEELITALIKLGYAPDELIPLIDAYIKEN